MSLAPKTGNLWQGEPHVSLHIYDVPELGHRASAALRGDPKICCCAEPCWRHAGGTACGRFLGPETWQGETRVSLRITDLPELG